MDEKLRELERRAGIVDPWAEAQVDGLTGFVDLREVEFIGAEFPHNTFGVKPKGLMSLGRKVHFTVGHAHDFTQEQYNDLVDRWMKVRC